MRTTWNGKEDRNESYFCYDQPIYSVADGKVVDMSDGAPENVPHSGQYAIPINFYNAAGNHAVVEIAPHRFVLYAHMRPGTVRVKVGDRVHTGEILGHVGNAGSSTEPHLPLWSLTISHLSLAAMAFHMNSARARPAGQSKRT